MSEPVVAVFSRTTGYRHDSIGAGTACLSELGAVLGLTVFATEDPRELVELLPRCTVVVFLSTSGEVLSPAARAALRCHVSGGGGFVGIHAATCTEYEWPYYGQLVGARFTRHPEFQPGTVLVEDRDHPATGHLPERWQCTDEWYEFDTTPRPRVRVLASADESTYDDGRMGVDHPLIWCHENLGGRVFYTALGHDARAFGDPVFRAHLEGGLRYAARVDG
ncbi:ThuA domain-containing protein [Streptomyces sp. LN785]|uniref:ThuA domain-containing protein n=1 Tax=Streptomyces sp. LN785 TaxID=3112983 RepID=UPI003723FE0E